MGAGGGAEAAAGTARTAGIVASSAAVDDIMNSRRDAPAKRLPGMVESDKTVMISL